MGSKEKIKLNEIDALTLNYLADYNLTSTEKDELLFTIPKKELNFYRKRLINLFKERTKELLKNENKKEKDTIDELIIKLSIESIKYFKLHDYHDLQQQEMSSIDISGLNQIESLPVNQDNYDEILYSKTKEKNNTLDNFVNIKSIKMKDSPVNYPKINKHNLKDENLKHKGIKKKQIKGEATQTKK